MFKTNLKILPEPARLLLNCLFLKYNSKAKNFEENIFAFNQEVSALNSNSLKSMQALTEESDEGDSLQQLKSNIFICFLMMNRVGSMAVSLENLRLILDCHFAI